MTTVDISNFIKVGCLIDPLKFENKWELSCNLLRKYFKHCKNKCK